MSVVIALTVLAYVGVSVVALFLVWVSIGFCDDAERSCARPWTTRRAVLWAGWFLLGVAVMTAAAVDLLPERGLLANVRLAAAPVLVGLAIALLTIALLANAANDA